LIFESAIGNYKIWRFSSPWLPPDVWNFSLSISDIYGISNHFIGIFNSTDSPPRIGEFSITILDNTSSGVLYRISGEIYDDYGVNAAVLYINGIEFSFTLINDSYITLDFFLTPGSYVLQLSVIDDINHETIKYLTNLHIQNVSIHTTTTDPVIWNNDSSQTSLKDTQQELGLSSSLGSLIEVGLGTSIFVILTLIGNFITRRKEV